MSQIKQKLKKIQQLAERGEAGEKDNANRLLKELLKKYRLTIEDLFEDEKKHYTIKYRHRWEKTLLFQIYAKVLNKTTINYMKEKYHSRVTFELTPSEYAEIKLLFDIYRKTFKEEIGVLVDAFISKHEIWSGFSSNDNEKIDYERLRKIMEMSRGLQDVTIPRNRLHSRNWARR